MNQLFTLRGGYIQPKFVYIFKNSQLIYRNDAVNNNDSEVARSLIIDHFKCKYIGEYGEKVLSFLKESGKDLY